jgi:hypothetical protein
MDVLNGKNKSLLARHRRLDETERIKDGLPYREDQGWLAKIFLP